MVTTTMMGAPAPRPPPSNTKALSAKERGSLEELRRLCSTHEVSWEQYQTKPGGDGNDTVTLMRYLQARDYVPPAAFKQYQATVEWREQINLDDLYTNADIAQFESIMRLFPLWTGRRNKRGVPVCAYRVNSVRTSDVQAAVKADPSLNSVFLPAEYSTQFVQALCGKMHADKAMPCATQIIDLSGVGVQQFWKLRHVLQKSSTTATAHYPESVDKIFILGAPSFFPTIWGYIQKWFEPAMTAKISVLSQKDVMPTLLQYMDRDAIPQWIGGDLAWEYGDRPNFDAETRRFIGSKLADNWVNGPLRVVTDEKGSRIETTGKTASGVVRKDVLAEIPAEEWTG